MPSKIVDALPKVSWGFFFVTIILIPFRYRFLLLARPVPLIWSDYTDFLLFAADITLLLTLVCWLAYSYLRRAKIEFGPPFLTLPLVGLTLTAVGTSITSLDPGLSLYHSIRLVILFGFYLYVVNHVRSVKQVIAPLSIMVAFQALVAIAQGLAQHSVGLQLLGEYQLDPAWSGVSVVWNASMRSLRAYGLSDHPNILGGCLAFALLIIMVWCLDGPKFQLVLFAVLALGLLALFFTYSRSAWLGFFMALGFVVFHRYVGRNNRTKRRDIALFASLLIVLFPFLWTNRELIGIRLGEQVSVQELPAEIGSMGERRVLISAANNVFAKSAVVGVGFGASPQAFLQAFPNFAVNYQPAHFILLTAAMETGLFGALFFLALIVSPWIALYLKRGIILTPDLLAASAVMLAITVVGFFDYYPWLLVPGRLWQYLAWGMWAAFYMNASRRVSLTTQA